MEPMPWSTGTLTRAAMENIFNYTGCVAKLKTFKQWRGRELMIWGHPAQVSNGFQTAIRHVEEIGDGGRKTADEQAQTNATNKEAVATQKASQEWSACSDTQMADAEWSAWSPSPWWSTSASSQDTQVSWAHPPGLEPHPTWNENANEDSHKWWHPTQESKPMWKKSFDPPPMQPELKPEVKPVRPAHPPSAKAYKTAIEEAKAQKEMGQDTNAERGPVTAKLEHVTNDQDLFRFVMGLVFKTKNKNTLQPSCKDRIILCKKNMFFL